MSAYKLQGYYLTAALTERVKAAWWALRTTNDEEGTPVVAESLSATVEELLEAWAAEIEEAYNNGEPFPVAPRGARGATNRSRTEQSRRMSKLWSEHRAADGSKP